MPKLEVQDMQNSSIAYIEPDQFNGSPELRTLNLSSTFVQGLVPKTFERLGKLQVLDLSRQCFGFWGESID